MSTGHIERMATVTLFLCCVLGSVSLVCGQSLGELICSSAVSAAYCIEVGCRTGLTIAS